MKMLKYLGLVVAAHVVLIVFIFAIPGCSTSKPTVAKTAGASSESAPVEVAPLPTPSALGFDPSAPAVVRASPTRPGSAVALSLAPPPPVEPAPAPATAVAAATSYTVKSKDSLWSIARDNHITVASLAAANNVSVSAVLPLGKKLSIPAAPTAKASATTPVHAESGMTTYTVKGGDTLGGIATRNHTTVTALRTLNNLTSDTVHVGQPLNIPVAAPSATAPAVSPAPGGVTHSVKANENLSGIAKKYGVKLADLEVANHITDPGKPLRIGQNLIIPGAVPVVTTSAFSVTPGQKEGLEGGIVDPPQVAPAPPPPSGAFQFELGRPAPSTTPSEDLVIRAAPQPPSVPPAPADGPDIKVIRDESGAPRIP